MTRPGTGTAEGVPTPPFWRAPWTFVVHTLVSIGCFVAIAGGAVAIHILVTWLELYGIDQIIIWGLKLAEYAVFGTDLLLFFVSLWKSARRTIGEL